MSFPIFSFGDHFDGLCRTVKGIYKEHYFGPVVQAKMYLKIFLFLALVAILFGCALPFGNFGRGPYQEQKGPLFRIRVAIFFGAAEPF